VKKKAKKLKQSKGRLGSSHSFKKA